MCSGCIFMCFYDPSTYSAVFICAIYVPAFFMMPQFCAADVAYEFDSSGMFPAASFARACLDDVLMFLASSILWVNTTEIWLLQHSYCAMFLLYTRCSLRAVLRKVQAHTAMSSNTVCFYIIFVNYNFVYEHVSCVERAWRKETWKSL